MTIKRILFSGALVASLMTLVACGDKSSDQAGGASSAQQAATTSTLLERVPADTPYLFLNTQGMSDELYDSYIQQNAGMIEAMSGLFADMDTEGMDADGQAIMHFAESFYTQLAAIKDSDSLREQTGFSPTDLGVIYGAGVFPAMLVETTDEAKTVSMINGLLSDEQGNNNTQQVQVDGVSVNKNVFAEDHVGFYWQVANGRLSAAILPVQLENDYLSSIFGDARPDNSLSMSQINQMNSNYGFTGYGAGYFDFVKAYDQLVNADTPEGAVVATMAGADDGAASFLNDPACIDETRALLNKAPRMYAGITELTESKVAIRNVFDMDSDVRTGLASVVGNASIGNDPKTPLNFGMNLNLAGLRDFIAEQTSNVMQSPFSCSHLAGLNDAALQMNGGVNQPMLPLIGTINGFRFSLANLNLEGLEEAGPEQIAQNLQGHMVVYSEQPSMLIGLGQMTLPFLAGMDLEPGGEPQPLDTSIVPMDIGPAYLATSESAIGLSIGDQQQNSLSGWLNPEADAEPVLFSFGIDYDLYAQFMAFALAQEESSAIDGEQDPDAAAERARAQAMMEQLQAMYADMGYTFGSVVINDKGMVMDQAIYRDQ